VRTQSETSDKATKKAGSGSENLRAWAQENAWLQSAKLEDEGEALARMVEDRLCNIGAEVRFKYLK
jgi:hypothetical protein